MNVILIEDEPLAIRELTLLLQEVAPELTIVACLDSVRSSVKWLKNNQVDIIFCDIHLGDGRSFDIFRQVAVKTPVIFITAYDEYAIQAFKNQGIDYILKPFDKADIQHALDKVRDWFSGKGCVSEKYRTRFLIQMGARIKSIPVDEVAYFMADGKYVMLYTKEGSRYVLDQNLGEIEGELDPKLFFRINRKFILHYHSIKDMVRYSNSRIKILLQPPVADELEVIVSSERMKDFKEWLNR